MKTHIDFETFGPEDLLSSGLSKYVKTAEILCMAYATDGKEPKLWTPGEPFPSDIDMNSEFYAHNAPFEFAVWNEIGVKVHGFPPLPIEKLNCTMAMAYTHSMPGSLEKLSPALGIDKAKDMAGSKVMMQLSKPRVLKDGTVTRWFKADVPEKFEKLYAYCIQDVVVETASEERMLPLTPEEKEVWILDHKINNRGIQIDIPSVKKAMAIIKDEKERLNDEIYEVSGRKVHTTNAVADITEYLEARGIKIESVKKSDVTDLLNSELPDDCRRILELRREGAKSSTAKLTAMIKRVEADGRIRNIHQYHGAGTGRWAGRGVNFQNLPRPSLKEEQIEQAISSFGKGAEYIDMFFGSPLSVISDCIRSLVTAAPGKDLLVVDFAAIEARVLAWLAGQESILEVFRTHGKIYEAQAAGIYNVKMENVTKDQRQIGKVAILALGYQGGVGAFQSMAKNYGVVVSDERADDIKVAWRKANSQTVKYWYALDEAAVNAVMNPGVNFKAGHKERQVTYRVSGSFLMCRLPSGRVLYYPYPKIEVNKFNRDAVTYMGEHPKTKKWSRLSFYGGLAAENITQAVSRDLLAAAMLRLERKCYEVVMHVHDEIVCEVDEKFGTLKNMINIVCELPAWAKDLPIAAEGYRAKRYRK